MFGGNFAPRGYALCDGQLMPINQNSALFSLLGTIYGGDGTTTFALPDLQSRLSIHMGRGPGLSDYRIGQASGEPSVTITSPTMASHNIALVATTGPANTGTVGFRRRSPRHRTALIPPSSTRMWNQASRRSSSSDESGCLRDGGRQSTA